jgi:hypothetical protein
MLRIGGGEMRHQTTGEPQPCHKEGSESLERRQFAYFLLCNHYSFYMDGIFLSIQLWLK